MNDVHVRHDSLRGRTLVRTLKILRRLEAGGRVTLNQLAEEHGVCPRTIRRDLYVLEEVGYALGHNPESGEGDDYTWWLVHRRERVSA